MNELLRVIRITKWICILTSALVLTFSMSLLKHIKMKGFIHSYRCCNTQRNWMYFHRLLIGHWYLMWTWNRYLNKKHLHVIMCPKDLPKQLSDYCFVHGFSEVKTELVYSTKMIRTRTRISNWREWLSFLFDKDGTRETKKRWNCSNQIVHTHIHTAVRDEVPIHLDARHNLNCMLCMLGASQRFIFIIGWNSC